MFFLVKEAEFLGKVIWDRGAYQYAKDRAVEGRDETSFLEDGVFDVPSRAW